MDLAIDAANSEGAAPLNWSSVGSAGTWSIFPEVAD